MLERATRECSTSPTMQTLRPSTRPKWSRSVRMSSRPWVGCSCAPSPALITLDGMRAARKAAAPGDQWRITTMSIRIASRLRAVSTSVSPLDTDERAAPMLTVSAASRFSANSKEMRVRCRRLEEEVDDRLASQHRNLADAALGDLLERLRRVEDRDDLLSAERFKAGQILAQRRSGAGHRFSAGVSTTASAPSSRGTWTSTCWWARTVKSRPTTSG